MTLAEKIFTLRRKNGLSQDDLANELGVSRQAVYKWESGLSTPEIDKIKILSKLFKVSFDYLLDDEIDDFEPKSDSTDKSERERQINYRTVFCVGEAQDENQSSIDHGFVGSKRDVTMIEAYFHRRMNAARGALDQAGASEQIFFKPEETTAWFYDDVRKAIGFYYAGKIQLVCPIENVIGFNVYVGGQVAINTYEFGLTSNGVLTYYDGGNIKEFEITLNPNDDYMLKAITCKQEADAIPVLYGVNRAAIEKNLNMVKQKIEMMKSVVLAEDFPMEDIDVEFYSKLNQKLAVEYANFQHRIMNPEAYMNQAVSHKIDDPDRIKLDQTVPEQPKSIEEMLKIPFIIGVIVAILVLWICLSASCS